MGLIRSCVWDCVTRIFKKCVDDLFGIMAAQWWKTAARNGSGVAAFNLATMYRAGRVTARDLVKAYAWFMVADDLGVITAKDHLRNLRELMSEPDLAKAERIKDGLLKDESSAAKG